MSRKEGSGLRLLSMVDSGLRLLRIMPEWRHFTLRNTGDLCYIRWKQSLKRKCPILPDYNLITLSKVFDDKGDYAIISQCQGLDESYSNEKVNDTWTCAITLCAIEALAEACCELGRSEQAATLVEKAGKLRKGLDQNVDSQGVMQSFKGCMRPHWGSSGITWRGEKGSPGASG